MDSVRKARRAVINWAKQNIPEKDGLKYDVNLNEFNQLTVRRGDIKNIVRHVHEYANEAYLLGNKLDKVLEDSEYIGWSYDEKIVNSEGKIVQRHPFVDYWIYYRFLLLDKYSYVNVFHDNQRKEYRVYCIRDSLFNTKIIQFSPNIKR